jgi:hypothetical protein
MQKVEYEITVYMLTTSNDIIGGSGVDELLKCEEEKSQEIVL